MQQSHQPPCIQVATEITATPVYYDIQLNLHVSRKSHIALTSQGLDKNTFYAIRKQQVRPWRFLHPQTQTPKEFSDRNLPKFPGVDPDMEFLKKGPPGTVYTTY